MHSTDRIKMVQAENSEWRIQLTVFFFNQFFYQNAIK